jgi:excisionase family DNA binding protein
MSCETLSLEDAAQFLQLSSGVLRERARSGAIKAAKPGKRWVFLKTDLVDYLDALYAHSCDHVGDCKENSLWPYKTETERGGLTSEARVEKEYAALLRLQTGH